MDHLPIDAHYVNGSPKGHLQGVIMVSQTVDEALGFSLSNDPFIRGVILPVDFRVGKLKQALMQAMGTAKIKVVRDSSPKVDSLLENGLKLAHRMGFCAELGTEPGQAYKISRIAEENPLMKIVLALKEFSHVKKEYKDLFSLQNVGVKFVVSPMSGYESFRANILHLIDGFGTERVMVGSIGSQEVSSLEKILEGFTDGERKNLCHNTPAFWYVR